MQTIQKKSIETPNSIRKSLIEKALSSVGQDLCDLENKISSFVPYQTAVAKRIGSHIFSYPGKKIRPALFFMSCRLLRYTGNEKLIIGIISELVHTASLLHDDVIDNSQLRRNRPTSNSVWGDKSAVLFGDLLYSRASELMAQTNNLEIIGSFAKSIREMSESELLQAENTYNFEISRNTYNQVIFGKTASLIGTSCKCAGLISNASENKVLALESFGQKLGLAFQLLDDVLDFKASSQNFGKKLLTDLQEGKVTFPIILLRDRAKDSDLKRLKEIFSSEDTLSREVSFITSLVDKYGTCNLTVDEAIKHTKEAVTTVERAFEKCPERENLTRLASCLVDRGF